MEQADGYCTPIKSAQRSLKDTDGFWVSPTGVALEQVEESPLLKNIRVKDSEGLDKIVELVEAAREILVKAEEGQEDAVPVGLEFMAKTPTTVKDAYSQLSQLLHAAKLKDVKDLGFPPSAGRAHGNKCVFFRAVAARAVDLAVIEKVGTSGLPHEWAGAVFVVGFEDAKPKPEYVTAFLKSQAEWVFGDYKGALSASKRRCLQRQLHRVMAALMTRPLKPEEVKEWVQRKQKQPQVVQSKAEFKQLVEEIIAVAERPLPSKRARQGAMVESSEEDKGVTSAGSFSDGGVSDAEGFFGSEQPRVTGSGRSGLLFSASEVASFLELRVAGFGPNQSAVWSVTGPQVRDMKPAAIRRVILASGIIDGLVAPIMIALQSLHTASIPHVTHKMSQEIVSGGGSSLILPATSDEPASSQAFACGGSPREGHRSRRDVQGFSRRSESQEIAQQMFGKGEHKTSASRIGMNPMEASYWLGSRVFWLEGTREMRGVISAARGLNFMITPDNGGLEEHWTATRTARGLAAEVEATHATGGMVTNPREVQSRVDGHQGLGAKQAIREVNATEVDGILERAYREMRTSGTFEGLGFGENGIDSGIEARVLWETMMGGGTGYKKVRDHKAMQLVVGEVKRKLKKWEVKLTTDQVVRLAFHTGSTGSLESLTCLSPSKKTRGATANERTKKQKLDTAGGSLCISEEGAEDTRIRTSWDSFGFTRAGVRRLFDVLAVVHGQRFALRGFAVVDDLLEDIFQESTGNGMTPLDTLLTDIWDELPLKLTAAVEAAAEGGGPTYMEMVKLDWEPVGWQKRRNRVLVDSFKEELVEVKEQLRQVKGKAGKRGGGGATRDAPRETRSTKRKQGTVDRPGLNEDSDPQWERFEPKVREWCEKHGFRSVHSARTDWRQKPQNKDKCFWTCAELGKVMGGECYRKDKCHFAASHPT